MTESKQAAKALQAEQKDLAVKVKTFEGEKDYLFVGLKRIEAMRVFHNVLLTVLEGIAQVGNAKTDEAKGLAMLSAIRVLDFDTFFYKLAVPLLNNVIIDDEEIGDLESTEYFETRPEELYLAVYHAILLNYPDFFGKVREALGKALKGFDLANIKAKLDLSNIA